MSKGGNLPMSNFSDTFLTILFFIAICFGGCF
jgi:hypothetical protein